MRSTQSLESDEVAQSSGPTESDRDAEPHRWGLPFLQQRERRIRGFLFALTLAIVAGIVAGWASRAFK